MTPWFQIYINVNFSVGGGWGFGWAKSGWFVSRMFSFLSTSLKRARL